MPPLLPEDIEHVLTHAAPVFPEIVESPILITGGTGFFGRWLLECLLAYGDRCSAPVRITVLSRDPERFASESPHIARDRRLTWVRGDVLTLVHEGLRFAGASAPRFGSVIHLATEGDNEVTRSDPLHAIDVISGGTANMLRVAQAVGARRFLFTSSGSVYGAAPPGVAAFSEDGPFSPPCGDLDNPYAISGEAKRHAELLCAAAVRSYGVQTVIARCFSFYGAHLPLKGKFAVGNFIRDTLDGRPVTVAGDGTPVRSYLYAADLTIWLLNLLVRGAAGRAYNVGSERSMSIRDVAEQVRCASGSPAPVQVAKTPDTSRPIHHYVPLTRRARDELGLCERVDFSNGIERMLRWCTAAHG